MLACNIDPPESVLVMKKKEQLSSSIEYCRRSELTLHLNGRKRAPYPGDLGPHDCGEPVGPRGSSWHVRDVNVMTGGKPLPNLILGVDEFCVWDRPKARIYGGGFGRMNEITERRQLGLLQ